MTRRTLLSLFIGISLFVAAYLFYVDYYRKQSIDKYFSHPKVGDIYKIKKDDDEGQSWVTYYKVEEVLNENILFEPSRVKSDASADYVMKQFQEGEYVRFTKKQLQEIKDGKWKNYQKDNTSLVEIIREE